MREILIDYYLEDKILFNVNKNSLFLSSFAFIKKVLASISQISRYFESLRRYFLTFYKKSVLYLDNSKNFKSLRVILRLSFTVNASDLNRFKIIERDRGDNSTNTNTSLLSIKA